MKLAALWLTVCIAATPAWAESVRLDAVRQAPDSDQWDLFYTSDFEFNGVSFHILGASSFDIHFQSEGGVVHDWSFQLGRDALPDYPGNELLVDGDVLFLDLWCCLVDPTVNNGSHLGYFPVGVDEYLGTATASSELAIVFGWSLTSREAVHRKLRGEEIDYFPADATPSLDIELYGTRVDEPPPPDGNQIVPEPTVIVLWGLAFVLGVIRAVS